MSTNTHHPSGHRGTLLIIQCNFILDTNIDYVHFREKSERERGMHLYGGLGAHAYAC